MDGNEIYTQVEENQVDENQVDEKCQAPDFEDDLDMRGSDIYAQVEGDSVDERFSTAGPADGGENPQETYETPVSTLQPGQIQPSSSDYEIPLELLRGRTYPQ